MRGTLTRRHAAAGVVGFIAGWTTWRYWFHPVFFRHGDSCAAHGWSVCYFGWILAIALLVAVITVIWGHE